MVLFWSWYPFFGSCLKENRKGMPSFEGPLKETTPWCHRSSKSAGKAMFPPPPSAVFNNPCGAKPRACRWQLPLLPRIYAVKPESKASGLFLGVVLFGGVVTDLLASLFVALGKLARSFETNSTRIGTPANNR